MPKIRQQITEHALSIYNVLYTSVTYTLYA